MATEISIKSLSTATMLSSSRRKSNRKNIHNIHNNNNVMLTIKSVFIIIILIINMIKFTNQMMMYQTNSSPAPLRIGRIPLKVPVIKGRVPYVTFTSTSNGQQIYSSLTDSAAASASTSAAAASTTTNDAKSSTQPLSSSSSPTTPTYQTYTERPILLQNNNNNNNNVVSTTKLSNLNNNKLNHHQHSRMINNRFPLNELVNVIAQAAINGDIPFNKVDLNKPFKMQQLQIPILLLRPEDIYKASGSNNINFKLITAQPIRIPIYDSITKT
uniref:Probable serine/threonine-protein kinase DDB_G0282963 n=1 Tax=Dermatophagoides pteronyssinus TaxID=6956 RepID=A0A6P6Y5T6_DERPT|nr:probable serine/threonine-protein kinase DDB_G0282963 [Dermatophagoides pteronyssinus]